MKSTIHLTKTDTNRANSQHSTGPRTQAGKRRSSLNAVRHALTGLTVVLPTDDMESYRAFVAEFHAELKPVGLLERAAAQTIADTHWRLNRIRTMENNLFANAFVEFSDDISTEDPVIHAALTQAKAVEVHADVLTKLSLYEQRLTRTLEKTQAELDRLQANRNWREYGKIEQSQPPQVRPENTKPPAAVPASESARNPVGHSPQPPDSPKTPNSPNPFRTATARDRS
jgi:hypothetical protein